jgi:hypothetical protein
LLFRKRAIRYGLRSKPRCHRAKIRGAQALGYLRHAVRRLRMARTIFPGGKLSIQVVLRDTQQARNCRHHAQKILTVARAAPGYVERAITVNCQLPATVEYRTADLGG